MTASAIAAKNAGQPDDEVRTLIPSIELRLLFRYDPNQPNLGALRIAQPDVWKF